MVMKLLAHDLLWGMPLPAEAPDWVFEALGDNPPVVVRRGIVAAGQVAVGIRGRRREQRYAASMPQAAITRRLSPEQLIDVQGTHDWPALQALAQLRPLLQASGLVWGVAGSAGHELASGIAALHAGSDLDLIIRTPVPVSRQWAADLVAALDNAVCRVDVQLQLPAGGLALREWAGSARQVLLKTDQGAQLLSDPWQPSQACA
ncbi:malonate decarboxylase holo-ACP synthase [Pseudomonas sp. 21LCFQ010]|uniref:malonate decarboxylase holo-ACP synthase n=1 Tax=Pseudomonas sp. 21LCFQ010 TaxID=2957506 RepID=UPI002097633F|nr:malonate decarboxylase holo-ACP synthase [Pseudomonas sp. 21LCFQ010]MCO8161587.1 malonate decarboxylase holo-ACP synthase [Pseudomonas sp. 21LCFQ010]